MSLLNEYMFGDTITLSGGVNLFKKNESVTFGAVTTPYRSTSFNVKNLATITVHIVGTASVKVISNPFDTFSGKDVVLQTISTAGATQYTVQATSTVCLEVTSMASGATVSARIVYEDGVD